MKDPTRNRSSVIVTAVSAALAAALTVAVLLVTSWLDPREATPPAVTTITSTSYACADAVRSARRFNLEWHAWSHAALPEDRRAPVDEDLADATEAVNDAYAAFEAHASACLASNADDDLEGAVRSYSAAFLGGEDDTAYDRLSARCRERLPRATFVELVDVAARRYGPLPVESVTVDQLAGDLARVTYTFSAAELNQRGEPWVREAGAWRNDDC